MVHGHVYMHEKGFKIYKGFMMRLADRVHGIYPQARLVKAWRKGASTHYAYLGKPSVQMDSGPKVMVLVLKVCI